MKKNSRRAQRIHTHVHGFMEAIAQGDHLARNRHLDAAIQLDRREWVETSTGGFYRHYGYDLAWFVQIATQHPDALAADETLRRLVEVTFPAQRRGQRAYRAGCDRQSNPYDSYLDEERREAWFGGWDLALSVDPDIDPETDADLDPYPDLDD